MLLKELTEMRAKLVEMRENARSSMRHASEAKAQLTVSYYNGEGVAFQRAISMIDEVINKQEFLDEACPCTLHQLVSELEFEDFED